MTTLWFAQALLPEGWRAGVRFHLADGRFARIEPGVDPAPGDERGGTAVPGMANLHSHAFQRIMAGFAETRAGPDGDDFWGWRELMYRLLATIEPDDLEAVAAMAFVEMLESGFTRAASSIICITDRTVGPMTIPPRWLRPSRVPRPPPASR